MLCISQLQQQTQTEISELLFWSFYAFQLLFLFKSTWILVKNFATDILETYKITGPPSGALEEPEAPLVNYQNTCN